MDGWIDNLVEQLKFIDRSEYNNWYPVCQKKSHSTIIFFGVIEILCYRRSYYEIVPCLIKKTRFYESTYIL